MESHNAQPNHHKLRNSSTATTIRFIRMLWVSLILLRLGLGLGLGFPRASLGFLPSQHNHKVLIYSNHDDRSLTRVNAQKNDSRKTGTKDKNRMSVQEIVQEVTKTAEKQMANAGKKYRRTRKKVDAPKQTYVYAAQRKEMERKGLVVTKKKAKDTTDGDSEGDVEGQKEEEETSVIRLKLNEDSPITIARKLGMNPALQSCDPSFALTRDNKMTPSDVPKVMGEVRVGLTESQTAKYAYIIQKPPGWTILEANKKKGIKDNSSTEEPVSTERTKTPSNNSITLSKKKTKKIKYYDESSDEVGTWELDLDAFDIRSVMTPEELEEFEKEGGVDTFSYRGSGANIRNDDNNDESPADEKLLSTQVKHDSKAATFLIESRPSVVTWLKDLKTSQGTPIRGGKYWKAVAGAVDTDDSGLVVLCPKENVESIFVDSAQYFAVVGNGQFLAPKGKRIRQNGSKQTTNDVKFEDYAKLRKGRGDDIVTTSKFTIPDGASTCNDAVQLCQNRYLDGIRGDPEGNPLERRANRRLVHCSALTVSSLTHDDLVECECEIPDDIRVVSERRNHHEFRNGSFLGRGILGLNEHTTAYREINGAADGWPGWIVDRYGKWLFVQHDENFPKGPLPSLHDGYTSGVYYFASDPDRSITGSVKGIKPTLLEGQPAPDMIEIKENGIRYLVNFDELSTGIFLDQRPQRVWLARHCTEETRVLNCFAHCGAYSIAAAIAGAHTTSLDLDKKWLDRIKPQMKANGIQDIDRHDCIYGDCK